MYFELLPSDRDVIPRQSRQIRPIARPLSEADDFAELGDMPLMSRARRLALAGLVVGC
jgi:hypothetical protein